MSGEPCPCGIGVPYDEHCARIHDETPATTAEDLMRARYSAHVLGDLSFLERSWHPDTVPSVLPLDRDISWSGLTIHRTERGGALDADGLVEFTAQFRRKGLAREMRELSRFVRLGTRWVYHEGVRTDQNNQS